MNIKLTILVTILILLGHAICQTNYCGDGIVNNGV
jgi:hypothetical protein